MGEGRPGESVPSIRVAYSGYRELVAMGPPIYACTSPCPHDRGAPPLYVRTYARTFGLEWE